MQWPCFPRLSTTRLLQVMAAVILLHVIHHHIRHARHAAGQALIHYPPLGEQDDADHAEQSHNSARDRHASTFDADPRGLGSVSFSFKKSITSTFIRTRLRDSESEQDTSRYAQLASTTTATSRESATAKFSKAAGDQTTDLSSAGQHQARLTSLHAASPALQSLPTHPTQASSTLSRSSSPTRTNTAQAAQTGTDAWQATTDTGSISDPVFTRGDQADEVAAGAGIDVGNPVLTSTPQADDSQAHDSSSTGDLILTSAGQEGDADAKGDSSSSRSSGGDDETTSTRNDQADGAAAGDSSTTAFTSGRDDTTAAAAAEGDGSSISGGATPTGTSQAADTASAGGNGSSGGSGKAAPTRDDGQTGDNTEGGSSTAGAQAGDAAAAAERDSSSISGGATTTGTSQAADSASGGGDSSNSSDANPTADSEEAGTTGSSSSTTTTTSSDQTQASRTDAAQLAADIGSSSDDPAPADDTQAGRQASDNAPADGTQQASDNAPADGTQQASDNAPADGTQQASDKAPADGTQQASDNAPADGTQQASDSVPADSTRQASDSASADSTQDSATSSGAAADNSSQPVTQGSDPTPADISPADATPTTPNPVPGLIPEILILDDVWSNSSDPIAQLRHYLEGLGAGGMTSDIHQVAAGQRHPRAEDLGLWALDRLADLESLPDRVAFLNLLFARQGRPVPLAAKVAICTTWTGTIKSVRRDLLPWMAYHAHLGVFRFYIQYDGEDHRVVKLLKSITAVRLSFLRAPFATEAWLQAWEVHRTKNAPEFWRAKPGNWALLVKQDWGQRWALASAEREKVDWLVHLDVDELIHLGGTRSDLPSELAVQPAKVPSVSFLPFEAQLESGALVNKWEQVTMFRQHVHFMTQAASETAEDFRLGNVTSFTHWYGNGKCAVRVAGLPPGTLTPDGPHDWTASPNPRWVTPTNPEGKYLESVSESVTVLHYTYCHVSELVQKAARTCPPEFVKAAREGNATKVLECVWNEYDHQAYMISAQGNFTATREHFYTTAVLSEGAPINCWHPQNGWGWCGLQQVEQLKQLLIRAGIMARISQPRMIMQQLEAQFGMFQMARKAGAGGQRSPAAAAAGGAAEGQAAGGSAVSTGGTTLLTAQQAKDATALGATRMASKRRAAVAAAARKAAEKWKRAKAAIAEAETAGGLSSWSPAQQGTAGADAGASSAVLPADAVAGGAETDQSSSASSSEDRAEGGDASSAKGT